MIIMSDSPRLPMSGWEALQLIRAQKARIMAERAQNSPAVARVAPPQKVEIMQTKKLTQAETARLLRESTKQHQARGLDYDAAFAAGLAELTALGKKPPPPSLVELTRAIQLRDRCDYDAAFLAALGAGAYNQMDSSDRSAIPSGQVVKVEPLASCRFINRR